MARRTNQTPEEQRIRLNRKRISENGNLIKCLECSLSFKRIGSHVVQVHGYEKASDYRLEHGLSKKECLQPEYTEYMSEIFDPERSDVTERGKATRFKPGGDHGERVSEYFKRKRLKTK